jgi:hypothetical protein
MSGRSAFFCRISFGVLTRNMIEDPPVGIYLPESCDLVIHRKLRIRHPIRPNSKTS